MRIAIRSVSLVALLATACLPARVISPYGRPATVRGSGGPRSDGELLAVSPDSIWLWRHGAVSGHAVRDVSHVTVERHPYGARLTMALMGGMGAVAGLMLNGACVSVESANCDGVFSGVFGFSLASGALFSIINHYSSLYRFSPGETDRLRPLARFPQGLPDSIRTAPRR